MAVSSDKTEEKKMAKEDENSSVQDVIVQSLWQLYQRSLREGAGEFSAVLGDALENCQTLRHQYHFSEATEDAFKQYTFVKGFLALDKKQQKYFLQHVEHPDQKVIYGVFPR